VASLGLDEPPQTLRAEDITSAPSAVELVVGDITDAKTCAQAAIGADVIVHLAANTGVLPSIADPLSDCYTNVIGTLNMLEAAHKASARRFVFASSGAPIGEVTPPIHEELPAHPCSPYGASKLSGEGYCSAYWQAFGVETVALRFGNVYGPGSGHKSSVVAKLIRAAISNQVFEVYGDGSQTRDYIYVNDLIDAIIQSSAVPGIGGQIFQIATSRETTLLELVDAISPILSDADFEPLRVTHSQRKKGDVQRNFSDTTKAAQQLGWRATTPLAEGLRRTVSSFQNL
jgi:UDP-glucose 4-epimerase